MGIWRRTALVFAVIFVGPQPTFAQLSTQECAEVGRDTVELIGRIERAQPTAGPFYIERPLLSRCVRQADNLIKARDPERVIIWPATYEARDTLLSRLGRTTRLLGVVIGISESTEYRFDPVAIDGMSLPPSPQRPPADLLEDMPPMDEGEETVPEAVATEPDTVQDGSTASAGGAARSSADSSIDPAKTAGNSAARALVVGLTLGVAASAAVGLLWWIVGRSRRRVADGSTLGSPAKSRHSRTWRTVKSVATLWVSAAGVVALVRAVFPAISSKSRQMQARAYEGVFRPDPVAREVTAIDGGRMVASGGVLLVTIQGRNPRSGVSSYQECRGSYLRDDGELKRRVTVRCFHGFTGEYEWTGARWAGSVRASPYTYWNPE